MFITKTSSLDSSRKRGWRELGNGLRPCTTQLTQPGASSVLFCPKKMPRGGGGTHARSPATQEKQQLAVTTADHYNETSNIHCVGFENTIHVDFSISSSIVLSVMRSTRSSAGFLICCCCGNQKAFFYRCAPFLFMGVFELTVNHMIRVWTAWYNKIL